MKKKRCNIMEWRKAETSWLADRENDRKVFRLINQKRAKGYSADRAIKALLRDEKVAPLMSDKTPKSWLVKYLSWPGRRPRFL